MLRFLILARHPFNTLLVKTPVAGAIKATIDIPKLKAKITLPKLKAKIRTVE